MSATDANWGYATVPQNTSCVKLEDSRCDYAVGHAVGGGTVINHMFVVRGNKRDYDSWEEMGNEGWGYDKLLEYFKLVEGVEIPSLQNSSYRGYAGPVPVNYPSHQTRVGQRLLRAAAELGASNADPNGASQSGMWRIQGSTRGGRRASAFRNYLRRRPPHLQLRARALATQVLFQGDRAVGVRYSRGGRTFDVFADKEVIVAGGPVNSPALLLRSGVGPRSHLEQLGIPVVKDLPVGYNLQDHVGLPWLLVSMNTSEAPSVQRLLINPLNLEQYKLLHSGPYTMLGTLETIGLHDLEGTDFHSPDWPQVEILYSSMSPVFSARSVKPFRFTEDTYKKLIEPVGNTPVFQATVWRLRPRSRGRVSLRSADPADAPLIDPQGLSDEEDVAVSVAGIRALQRVLRAPALREVDAQLLRTPLPGCEERPWDSDEYWRCALRMHGLTLYHPCCTNKMGPGADADAVVAPDLKVRGLKGLRVADTSVMPTLVSGHLQMAAYVIGEKAADLIKRDYPGL
ncbi:hypothetical protein R5R35_008605 [Gryllus longicercus]|uniref:Glucose-methanol-choline oxidoreductase N-terminal domain-containing protein n=1 Tax=Gryllus longicercus TaxID=2509291 RepID=A0AAN9Z0M9_9ORTH